jgi:hypothetical protein
MEISGSVWCRTDSLTSEDPRRSGAAFYGVENHLGGGTVEGVYRFTEHTAELELELEADSPEEVFEETRRAFVELAGTGDGETVERRVSIEATDLPALLAAWLDELVFLADDESAGLARRVVRLVPIGVVKG